MSLNTKESVRVMVDMSATLIHNGHIRILKKAKNCIKDKHIILVVGLTTDDEVKKHKNYNAELSYEERKEVLDAIIFVDEVVPTTWEITDDILTKYNIDYLAHGSDNSNDVDNIIVFPRTEGISSQDLRERAMRSIVQQRNSVKPMFTPESSNLSVSNVIDIKNVYGENDEEYNAIEKTVLNNILNLVGQDHIFPIQGSTTTAIDIATTNFVLGNVLIIVSGYHSKQLIDIYERKLNSLPQKTQITIIAYDDIETELSNNRTFDWIATTYVDSDNAFLADIHLLKKLKQTKQSKLFLDITSSINLEEHHEFADACVFNSSNALGGILGACFISYNEGCLKDHSLKNIPWSFDINNYLNKKITSPSHAICSLYTISKNFESIKQNVKASKQIFIKKYSDRILRNSKQQPISCTIIKAENISLKKGVSYKPKSVKKGQTVISHLGNMFTLENEIGDIYNNLKID